VLHYGLILLAQGAEWNRAGPSGNIDTEQAQGALGLSGGCGWGAEASLEQQESMSDSFQGGIRSDFLSKGDGIDGLDILKIRGSIHVFGDDSEGAGPGAGVVEGHDSAVDDTGKP